MRVFAGLPLPERTRETIAAWMNTWEAERKALKPVQPTGLHVTLHFFGGLSLSETARVMGRSQVAVKSLIHRALRDLRKRLDDE